MKKMYLESVEEFPLKSDDPSCRIALALVLALILYHSTMGKRRQAPAVFDDTPELSREERIQLAIEAWKEANGSLT